LDEVASYSEADPVDFRFVGTDVHYEPSVGNNFSFGDGLAWDEKKYVRAFNEVPKTLRQSSKLIRSGFVPDSECDRIVDEVAIFKDCTSVFIYDWVGHGHGYFLEGSKGKRTEDPGAKRLGLMDIVLASKGLSAAPRDSWGSMLLFKCSNKLTPAIPCGIYGALTESGCGVMGMTVVGGSGVGTLGSAT
jgi:hypothetical protein